MSTDNKSWEQKSDRWLVEVLKRGDDPDVSQAIIELQRRYGDKLERSARAKLPFDWVEETVQKSWVAFYRSVLKYPGDIHNVGGYLYRIARNHIADAAEMVKRERQIEYDLGPVEDETDVDIFGTDQSAENTAWRHEEQIVAETQLEFTNLVPFVDKVLSDCQRVMWLLVRMLEYPQNVVSRLMGKKYDTTRSQYRHAHNKLLTYFKGEEFANLLQFGELPQALRFAPRREAGVVVERFAEMTTPQFTPDELKPLGLTVEEFEKNYVASIITPRWFRTQAEMELNRPSLLLIRRAQWSDLGVHLQKLYSNLKDTAYTPLECLIDFTVEDGHIILKPSSLVEMIPDPNSGDLADNTYVSAHQPRMTRPVIWGFWDKSMADEETVKQEYEHWPFMRGIGDWYDFTSKPKE